MSILADLAIAKHAAHAGEHEAGLRACERLLSRPAGLPAMVEAEARAARTWYVPHASTLFPSFDPVEIPPDLCTDRPAGWSTFNPSCLVRGDELLVLVRSSNYRIVEGQYVVPPEDNTTDGTPPWIRTRTLLLRASLHGAEISFDRGEAVQLYGPDYESSGLHITGIEDLRIRLGQGDELVVSGTCLDFAGLPPAPNGSPVARIATAKLLPDAGVLTDFECLQEPFPGRYEKNWSPIEGKPDTWLYAAWEDGRVATIRRAEGSWIVEPQGKAPFAMRHLRGRSQLIRFRDCWIGIFGEATDDGRRMYDHRFVWFNDALEPRGWSPPFRVGPQRGVEFVAGLAWQPGSDYFVLSYGLQDEQAFLATVPWFEVVDSFQEIPC
jgi:hypothetical protein